MELYSNDKIIGLSQYAYYGQNERVDELNDRIKTRQFPDSPLQPNFDPRPVPTKYSIFPLINRRKPMNEPVVPYLDYNIINFNPGTQNAPPSGYFNNIDTETILRNQTFAYQRGADQSIYIPESNSDMYKVSIVSRPSDQPHPDLFGKTQFSSSVHPNMVGSMVGKDYLFNHTRTQLRNSQY